MLLTEIFKIETYQLQEKTFNYLFFKKCSFFIYLDYNKDTRFTVIIPFFNLVPISIYYPSIFLITFHSGMFINSVNANPTKWSNILKQFVGNLPTDCLTAFDHFVILVPKGLEPFTFFIKRFTNPKNIFGRPFSLLRL